MIGSKNSLLLQSLIWNANWKYSKGAAKFAQGSLRGNSTLLWEMRLTCPMVPTYAPPPYILICLQQHWNMIKFYDYMIIWFYDFMIIWLKFGEDKGVIIFPVCFWWPVFIFFWSPLAYAKKNLVPLFAYVKKFWSPPPLPEHIQPQIDNESTLVCPLFVITAWW